MSVEPIVFRQVDAFSKLAFSGNPAGVCVYKRSPGPDESTMRSIAAEMNLSETAFLVPEGENMYSIRYFTPTIEVGLCGHATLAGAHVLYEESLVERGDTIVLHAKSGTLKTHKDGNWIVMDFPVDTYRPISKTETELLVIAECLGVSVEEIVRPVYLSDMKWHLVELSSESAVAACKPDFRRMMEEGYGSLLPTAKSDTQDTDFVSRFFAPAVGIDEDPVTGSAHCTLTPFWVEKLGRSPLLARQISSRGGLIRVGMDGNRVRIAGQAVTVFRLEMYK